MCYPHMTLSLNVRKRIYNPTTFLLTSLTQKRIIVNFNRILIVIEVNFTFVTKEFPLVKILFSCSMFNPLQTLDNDMSHIFLSI